ncbi:MAG TPA: 3-deoxy-D-manno-octulosonic acid transferase [Terriglobales bacterium]|nr:3-deoxy-D-manno-octulosonic acid transferase [Terriglobales bacterium]
MHFLYSAALLLALLVTLPYWLWKMLAAGKYRSGLAERLGSVPPRILRRSPEGCIWVHAVSVGEVLAIGKLVEGLAARHPGRRLFVSTTTATGQKLARERFGEENVFFFPLDLGFSVRSYMRALRPAMVVLAETEFWPNFLHAAHSQGARVAVVNARISDRSFPRYRWLRFVWRHVLRRVAVFLAQSGLDAQRLVEIGAPAERVRVAGNLKFDIAAPAAKPVVEMLGAAFARSGVDQVIVAGSTVEGEEPLLLDAFRPLLKSHPRTALVLAPRHPERFESVAGLLLGSSSSFIRRSRMTGQESCAGAVILLDTIGELAAVYTLASVAFVGGSLVPRGGHNILEPAQHGVPIVTGPHTENFRDIVNIFSRAGAVSVAAPEWLSAELLRLLDDSVVRRELGQRAADVFRSQSGATARTLEALETLLPAVESRAG